MSRNMKTFILITINIMLAVIFSAIYIYQHKLYWSSDEELIRYAKNKFDVDIEVIENRGALDPINGGVAEVKTIDGDNLHFDIYMNMFGIVSGNSYQVAKNLRTHNQTLDNLEFIQQLKETGIPVSIAPHPARIMPPEAYKRYTDDVEAYFLLDISEVDLNREATIETIYAVYQLAQDYQTKVEQNEELSLNELEIKFIPANNAYSKPSDITFELEEIDSDSDDEENDVRFKMVEEDKSPHEYIYVTIDDKQYNTSKQFEEKLSLENWFFFDNQLPE